MLKNGHINYSLIIPDNSSRMNKATDFSIV